MVEGGTETDPQPQLEIRLLGPVAAIRGGVAVDLGGIRAQTLLALLALRAGSPVSAESIVDELWAGEPPDGALTTLRSYVSRLRSALGDDVSIERTTAGYVLDLPPEAIDAVRFEGGVRDADALIDRGRHRRAAEVLRAALGLWRGEPFAGLPNDGGLRAEATRLEELRLHALESRLAADLASGRAAELVDETEALLRTNPFRERLWLHLMLALYRSGRQADALAAYHRARTELDEHLGIEPGPELQALEAAILHQEVADVGSRPRPSGSLPVALTRFIGRSGELDDIHGLLGRARLLTLVGVGGVGKTRLAIEAASRELQDRSDRVDLVDLAALSEPSLVVDHVAAGVGAGNPAASGLIEAIREAVGTGDVLLVLDNCEHVREAAANLAQALLASSSDLRILATSRVALDVAGEAVYPVPPMTLAGRFGDAEGPDAAAASDAVQLLLDRATLTRHDLVVDDAAYETAARIVRELDGLPLAIELAAARTKALSLDEIADRLRDRFQFLVSGNRISAARHRTLRETMDWSFELLEPDEQRLLARLSVFPAGATLPAIAAVCLGGDAAEAERLIERLVDASLLVPVQGSRGTRYRQLETVRQYGDELLPSADRDALQRAHAEHMRTVAVSTHLSLEGTSEMRTGLGASFEVAREELPSIRAAIDWAAAHDVPLGLQIAAALERFWVSAAPSEGIATFTRLLEAADVPDELRARALRCRGGALYVTGAFSDAVADYEAALALHRRLDQPRYVAHLLTRLAVEAHRVEDLAGARALLAEAAQIGGADRFVPDRYVILSLEGDLAFDEGRVDEALAIQQEAGAQAAAAGDEWWRADTLMRIADRALRLGRTTMAGPAAREALRWARSIEDRQTTLFALGLLAWEAAATGATERAGRIWGGILAEVARPGRVGQWDLEAEEFRAHVATDDATFRAAVAGGRSLSLDQVVELALEPA